MRLALSAIVAALIPTLFTVVIAQNPPPIWAGSYTTAQAERGRAVVEAHCGECHQDDLSGGEGPALVGPTFMLKWELNSVERLFHKIRDTMPEAGSSDVIGRGEARDCRLHPAAERISRRRYRADRRELRSRTCA